MTEKEVKAYPTRTEVGYALLNGGALSPHWLDAYVHVPREAFLPDEIWPFDMETGRPVHVSRTADPDAWRGYAAADVPIVTQWDDGTHEGPEPGHMATSSASMPSVVFRMLNDLTLDRENRVLEIGTGTGWNAALLAHVVGEENVITVEVDESVATQAQQALSRFFGDHLEVIHGDGFAGVLDHGSFDRVIATCGVREIPLTWVRQCRPGGIIVAPWGTDFTNADATVRLQTDSQGESASGEFVGPVEFMKLRAHRADPINHETYAPRPNSTPAMESGEAPAEIAASGRFGPLPFALGVRVPDCTFIAAEKQNGVQPLWFYSRSDHSWACVMVQDCKDARVWQDGTRRLWSEVRAAYDWWVGQGRPEWPRFGLTVSGAGQHVWLDDPANPV